MEYFLLILKIYIIFKLKNVLFIYISKYMKYLFISFRPQTENN